MGILEAPGLIVLGAGADQRFLIRTAQEMGFQVLAFDQDPTAPASEDADEAVPISTRDHQRIIRWLEEHHRDIRGAITMGSDISDSVWAIAERLDLPRLSQDTIEAVTNKLAMKRCLEASSIPTPYGFEAHYPEDLTPGHVLKPIDRSGSRGVFLLPDHGLEDLYHRSKAFSHSGRVMMEEHLEGPQVSTETVMYEGEGTVPGFADRNYDQPHLLPQIMENGGWAPSALPEPEQEEIRELSIAASKAIGVHTGVTKADIVLTPEGPQVIEISARLSGGDFCESLAPLSTGVNYVRQAIQIATGERPEPQEPTLGLHVANRYFFPDPGVLRSVQGTEAVREKEWVRKLELWYEPGDLVPAPLSHAHRFGVFVVVAEDRKTLIERIAWVYDTVRIDTGASQIQRASEAFRAVRARHTPTS
jgi:biotin carboxylase